jgi:hydrogenase maturation protease
MDAMTDSMNPTDPTKAVVDTLIIGCGNLLRGDDAVGPVLIRHLWEMGLPEGVNCADGGTGGMDVAFQMRGVRHVILVDACVSDSEPGAIFKLPGEAVETLPPLAGINLHAFRWDHALTFAHWLLKEDYPKQISVYLIEAQSLVIGDPLSEPVAASMRKLAGILLEDLSQRGRDHSHPTHEMPLGVGCSASLTGAGHAD